MLIIFYLFFFLLLIDFVSLHTVMPGEHPWPHLCVFLQYYEPTLFWLNKMIFKGTFLWYFSSPPPKKNYKKQTVFFLLVFEAFISSAAERRMSCILCPFLFFFPLSVFAWYEIHRGLSVLPEWSGTCGPLLTSFEERAFCLNVPVKAGQVRVGRGSGETAVTITHVQLFRMIIIFFLILWHKSLWCHQSKAEYIF